MWRSTGVERREVLPPVPTPVTRRGRGSARASRPSARVPSAGAPVLALLLDRVARARVCEAVRGRAPVRFCTEASELITQLGEQRPCAVMVEGRDQCGRPMLNAVAQIRAGHPSLPVIAYVVPGATASADILALAQAGVHELVMQGFDDVGVALRTALERAVAHCAAARVLTALHPHVPVGVTPFLRYCLERAAYEPSVTEAARYLGVHRKTLVYRLQQAALPTPRAMIGWCRLFLAAHLLEDPRRSVAEVALELGFASSAALRGMLRRYTGLRPRDLRADGGLDALLARFVARLRR